MTAPPAKPLIATGGELVVSPRRLAAFADRLVVRDPRGRSRHPSLVRERGLLRVRGPFSLRHELSIDRARGVAFADATGDPNRLHREGEVVPGAMIAAALVSQLELLLPGVRPTSLRVTFEAVSWYRRGIRLVSRVQPTPQGVRVEATGHQDRRQVVSAVLEGRFEVAPPRIELDLARVDSTWLLRVLAFYKALGIDGEAWFHKADGPDLSYPIAFLACLPSADMVRRFEGDGGVLNRLMLEFDAQRLPLSGPPEVSLELPARLRRSFNRVLTAVRDGVRTAVRGTALVLAQAPEELRAGRPAAH